MQQFEFVHYGEDAAQFANGVREYRSYRSESSAKSYAGRLSRKIKGPVDVARAGGGEWNDRYMTTAHPDFSGIWAAGFHFERLD